MKGLKSFRFACQVPFPFFTGLLTKRVVILDTGLVTLCLASDGHSADVGRRAEGAAAPGNARAGAGPASGGTGRLKLTIKALGGRREYAIREGLRPSDLEGSAQIVYAVAQGVKTLSTLF